MRNTIRWSAFAYAGFLLLTGLAGSIRAGTVSTLSGYDSVWVTSRYWATPHAQHNFNDAVADDSFTLYAAPDPNWQGSLGPPAEWVRSTGTWNIGGNSDLSITREGHIEGTINARTYHAVNWSFTVLADVVMDVNAEARCVWDWGPVSSWLNLRLRDDTLGQDLHLLNQYQPNTANVLNDGFAAALTSGHTYTFSFETGNSDVLGGNRRGAITDSLSVSFNGNLVPLPSAAWGGIALLGLLGARAWRQRNIDRQDARIE